MISKLAETVSKLVRSCARFCQVPLAELRSSFLLNRVIMDQSAQSGIPAAGEIVDIEGDDVMRDGSKVIMAANNERFFFVTLSANKKIKLQNKKIDSTQFFGHPFGSTFVVNVDGTTQRVESFVEDDLSSSITGSRNNANLVDSNTSQKLSAQEIEDMKQGGKGGSAIIDALVANSDTFGNKTEYAQEKYKARKAKKYCQSYTFLKPTVATVCECHFGMKASLISWLRVDTLSLMLCLANVTAYQRVLVVESCLGLVCGAIAHQTNQLAQVCLATLGPNAPNLDAFKKFNFRSDHNVRNAALVNLRRTKDDMLAKEKGGTGESDIQNDDGDDAVMTDAGPDGQEGICKDGDATGSKPGTNALQDDVIPMADQEQVDVWCRQGFDCCLIAAPKIDPTSLAEYVWPLLSPSAPFVIYSPYLGPLTLCRNALIDKDMAALVEVQETWWREYQVLPNRTHPVMDGKGTGGFLLSGHKIIHADAPPHLETMKRPTGPIVSKRRRNNRRRR